MDNDSKLKPILSVLFKLLAKRDYAKQELSAKLKTLGYIEDEIETALNQAIQQGFLNDYRFTENYIRQRSQRGYGKLRIQTELKDKGITDNIISELMPDESFWQNLAIKVREKRFGEIIPQSYAEKAKQMRFLQYRGFAIEQISPRFFHNYAEE